MKTSTTIGIALGFAAALSFSSTAAAQEQESNMLSRVGMQASIGGGVVGFTDSDTTDFINVGGLWEARVAVGTNEMIAGEVAYTGSAQGLDTIGVDNDALLVSTGLEAAARVNILNAAGSKASWQPYALAGVGWRRYDLTNTDTNTSSITDEDNVLEVPLGVGVAYRYDKIVLDVRGVFRPAVDNDLIATTADQPDTQLHNWSASARLGFEF